MSKVSLRALSIILLAVHIISQQSYVASKSMNLHHNSYCESFPQVESKFEEDAQKNTGVTIIQASGGLFNVGGDGELKAVEPANMQLLEPAYKRMKGVLDYSYEEPVVHVPDEARHLYSIQQIKQIEAQAFSKYAEAMQTLEESYADLVFKDTQINSFIMDVCDRLNTLVHIWAEVNYEKKCGKEHLNRAGITLEENSLLSAIYLEGRQKEWMYSGQVGSNPLALRRVLTQGNLRERMVLIRYMADGFVGKILENSSLTEQINGKLRDKGIGWSLHHELIPNPEDLTYPEEEGKIYHCGIYAQLTYQEKLHQKRSVDEIEQLKKTLNPTIKDALLDKRAPLSDREYRYWTRSAVINQNDMDRKINWDTGAASFKAFFFSENPASRYLEVASKVKVPLLVGVSGTTDKILTQIMFLGFTTKEELYKGRLALLGHLINTKSHSSHEVLFSSKSFGLLYEPGPRGYETVFPMDLHFTKRLQQKQRERGYELPDYYLSSAYVLQQLQSVLDSAGVNP